MCLSQEPVNIRNQPKTGASTMNKNECKRCSECKHYRPIEQQAAEDIGDCTLYPEWIEVFPYHYCGQWASTGRTKQSPSTITEEPQGLDIDWNLVPEGYDWAAQDEDGLICVYEIEPDIEENQWCLREIRSRYLPINKGPNPNWRNTLTKRPGT